MSEQQFTTPILFLIFNRPDTTAQVFQRIRVVKPRYLYVAADGPRPNKPGEVELCQQARDVVLHHIDWNCELKTRFQEGNLGCKLAVSSAITWFFQNVEKGIILEDDCLPDLSFFNFCKTLLEYYKDTERVMHISGNNFQDGRKRGTGSYYPSQLAHIWGWATWKRAWQKYDLNMHDYPVFLNKMKMMFPNKSNYNYWKRNFDLVYNNKKDTWDLQWQYAVFLYNGIALHPNVNLVSNIGFNTSATHTIDDFHPLSNIPRGNLEDIIHPDNLEPDKAADLYTLQKYLNPSKIIKGSYLIKRIIHNIYNRAK